MKRFYRVYVLTVFLSIIVAQFIVTAAYAQSSTTINFGPFWDAIVQYLLMPMVVALIGILGLLANKWLKKLGIDIDLTQATQLNKAAENAAGQLFAKVGSNIQNMTIDTGNPLVADAVMGIQRNIPGVISHFGINEDQIAEKIEAKLGQLLAVSSSAPVTVTGDNTTVVATAPKVG